MRQCPSGGRSSATPGRMCELSRHREQRRARSAIRILFGVKMSIPIPIPIPAPKLENGSQRREALAAQRRWIASNFVAVLQRNWSDHIIFPGSRSSPLQIPAPPRPIFICAVAEPPPGDVGESRRKTAIPSTGRGSFSRTWQALHAWLAHNAQPLDRAESSIPPLAPG